MIKYFSILLLILVTTNIANAKPDLVVYGSHRLDAPLKKIITAFEKENKISIKSDFGCGAPKLIPSLKAKQDGDVLILGEDTELKLAKKAGLVDSSSTVAWNPFVIVVKKGNPIKVKSPADLKKARLNLPQQGSGCASRLSDSIVSMWGLSEAASKAERLDRGCKSTLGSEMVARGESDATFTWRIVAAPVRGIEMIPIEKTRGAPCECYGIVLNGAKNPELAKKFVDYLKGPKAQAIFREAGMLDLQEKAK
ncbi:MAG TPA: substrate-binding domain-containing protein [Spirochaetota bacterium]|nr:substrate-binding domain-containing protein [Spirochaetota bacterium]HPC42739.1 substrate-binding domain-containing protein [Spirochaetota bacterium]HQJ73209.1 substrate-binding domain-containing protein [Spirochaetota bacterium]HRS78960.1 substrate-binding domain-containing protein [Spirochaetota bacterium]HRT76850.1 substrate-binding domain-containing protein [Spirochaetota bacterium]